MQNVQQLPTKHCEARKMGFSPPARTVHGAGARAKNITGWAPVMVFSLAIPTFLMCSCRTSQVTTERGSAGTETHKATLIDPERLCEQPERQYAAGIKVAVEAAFAKLSGQSEATFKTDLEKTIQNLYTYSKDGLDIALLMSQTCKTALVLGFSPKEVSEFWLVTLRTWRNNPQISPGEEKRLEDTLDSLEKRQDEVDKRL